MAQQTSRLYEAMFLTETNIAADFQAIEGMIETIMERAQAELLVCRLWDERRLAYDIDKHKRAAYVLCYFRAKGTTIGRIERDVQLSEHLLRVLVLRADHITDEQLEQIKDQPGRRAAGADQGDSTAEPTKEPAKAEAGPDSSPEEPALEVLAEPGDPAVGDQEPLAEVPAEQSTEVEASAEQGPQEQPRT